MSVEVIGVFSTSLEGNTDKSFHHLKQKFQELNDTKIISFFFRNQKPTKERHVCGIFPLNEVLPYVSNSSNRVTFHCGETTYNLKLNSNRLRLFKENQTCICCGIKGEFFLLEKFHEKDNPHFNLYSADNNKITLMTRDHIVPKSCNGSDALSNLQVLCSSCNALKSHHPLSIFQLRQLLQFQQRFKPSLPSKIYRISERIFTNDIMVKRGMESYFIQERPPLTTLKPLYKKELKKRSWSVGQEETREGKIPENLIFWFTIDGICICSSNGEDFLIPRELVSFL